MGGKDGNGDPIPDSPQGILLLGDGDGKILIPTGKKTGRNQSPSGLAGTGMGDQSPYPISASPPRLVLELQIKTYHHRRGPWICPPRPYSLLNILLFGYFYFLDCYFWIVIRVVL